MEERIWNNTEIRLYMADFGWNVRKRFEESLPGVQFDDRKMGLHKKALCSKLVVIDNNATVLLETLSANVPSIIFFNRALFEIREKAKAYFDELGEAKIFFTDPVKAATHLNDIYDDIESWWLDPKVETVKDNFVKQFARTSKRCTHEWQEKLFELAAIEN